MPTLTVHNLSTPRRHHMHPHCLTTAPTFIEHLEGQNLCRPSYWRPRCQPVSRETPVRPDPCPEYPAYVWYPPLGPYSWGLCHRGAR